jgi:hypothetical protein
VEVVDKAINPALYLLNFSFPPLLTRSYRLLVRMSVFYDLYVDGGC